MIQSLPVPRRSSTLASNSDTPRRFGWPHAFAIVASVVMILGVGAGFYVFQVLRRAPDAVLEGGRELARGLQEIARAFTTGTVTTSFVSYATTMSGSTYLQFATLDQMEVFERTDRATTLWGKLDLPEVVVEARAPVTTTYYVDLQEEWTFELQGEHLQVSAPAIRYNKPAIDASAVEYRIRTDSVLRDEEAALEALRQGLQAMAAQRARHNVPLVRELGRRKIADFVEGWLLQSFGDASRAVRVDVRFADEPQPGLLRAPQPPEVRVPSPPEPGQEP